MKGKQRGVYDYTVVGTSGHGRRLAIVIANQDYRDPAASRLPYPQADATLLCDTLVARYRLPGDQVAQFTDESLVRLQQAIPDRLSRIGADGQLLVFWTGHAYKDDEGKTFLALKDSDLKRIDATGLSLQWLVDELEKCRAKDKLLLLDTSHAGRGADLAKEPSTAEMIYALKAPPGRRPLRTVTAIASCNASQRGADWPQKGHGLFAWFLSRAYAGDADKNRDNRLEPTELFGYLQEQMPTAAAQLKLSQTPS